MEHTHQAMEAPLEGFQELEKAFDHATPALMRAATISEDRCPASYTAPETAEARPRSPADSQHTSPTSPQESDRAITITAHRRDSPHNLDTSSTSHALSRHTSGLPPTPPNNPILGVEDTKASPAPSPATLFADPVRNALATVTTGLSTPLAEHQSPPTPDPSPPGTRGNLLPTRPSLTDYASSYAGSFQTAKESLGNHTSKSPIASPLNPAQVDHLQLSTPHLRSFGLGLKNVAATVSMQDDHDDARIVRPKVYVPDPESSDRVATLASLASEKRRLSDEPSAIPMTVRDSSQSSVAQQVVVVRKTRAVSQPVNGRIRETTQTVTHARAVSDSRALKIHRPAATSTQTINVAMSFDASPGTDAFKLHVPNGKGYEPTEPERDGPTSSPVSNAAARRSLDENNLVYKLIQSENVKRHSGVSDGSVPAVVLPVPEYKHHLRHTPKRESLRSDAIATPQGSKRSSVENGHTLRHKRRVSALSSSEMSPSSPETSPAIPQTALAASSPAAHRVAFPSSAHEESRSTPFEKGPAASHHLRSPISSPQQSLTVAKLRGAAGKAAPRVFSQPVPGTSPPAHWQPKSTPSPRLRHFSHERRLERIKELERPRQEDSPPRQHEVAPTIAHPESMKAKPISDQVDRGIVPRIASSQGRKLSSDRTSIPTTPRRHSFDLRSPNLLDPAMSASQLSYRTDVELCEARGVKLFPHNNESVVVINERVLQNSEDSDDDKNDDINERNDTDDDDNDDDHHFTNASHPAIYPVTLQHRAPPSTPPPPRILHTPPSPLLGQPKYFVDSPLTNPRAAPAPPIIQFIPPTPVTELDEQLPRADEVQHSSGVQHDRYSHSPRRQLSLTQRVRRYSEGLMQPLSFNIGLVRSSSTRSASVRRAAATSRRYPAAPPPRPTHLSSFWQPRDFWEDWYSDSSIDNDDDADFEPLPPGGDTSDLGHDDAVDAAVPAHALHSGFTFPRSMSVRMPGFRGTGGFLIGNSIGIDRHGSNNRRHYISVRRRKVTTGVIQKRPSSGALVSARARRDLFTSAPFRTSALKGSSSSSSGGRRANTKTLAIDSPASAMHRSPHHSSHTSVGVSSSRFSGNSSNQSSSSQQESSGISLARLQARVRQVRDRRREKKLEDRRDRLREMIGHRVYVDAGNYRG